MIHDDLGGGSGETQFLQSAPQRERGKCCGGESQIRDSGGDEDQPSEGWTLGLSKFDVWDAVWFEGMTSVLVAADGWKHTAERGGQGKGSEGVVVMVVRRMGWGGSDGER